MSDKFNYLICWMKVVPHGFSVGNCTIDSERPIDISDFPGINERVQKLVKLDELPAIISITSLPIP